LGFAGLAIVLPTHIAKRLRITVFHGVIRVLIVLLAVSVHAAADTRWLLIDTHERVLSVMEADRPLAHFEGLAFGVAGVGMKQRYGDGLTPLGTFRLGWINRASRFERFFGLDYPNREHAELALQAGRIDQITYDRILSALDTGRTPPQNTPLGGAIGIHGIGSGDPDVHRTFNWTDGCIAMTNAQIRDLERWIRPGMTVVVR
jgi:murein L,D-transpeptidase YafK